MAGVTATLDTALMLGFLGGLSQGQRAVLAEHAEELVYGLRGASPEAARMLVLLLRTLGCSEENA